MTTPPTMSPIEYQSLAKRTAGRFENINDALVYGLLSAGFFGWLWPR